MIINLFLFFKNFYDFFIAKRGKSLNGNLIKIHKVCSMKKQKNYCLEGKAGKLKVNTSYNHLTFLTFNHNINKEAENTLQ